MATLSARQPHLTASARDIVEYPESVAGWLRRLGKVERILTPTVLNLLKIKWRQRFIVLVGGHLYMYKDETSSTPLHVSPLVEYYAVTRAMNDPNVSMVPWSFKVEPRDDSKMHYFASTCQKDMEKWMGMFKREMMKAHKVPISSTDRFDSGDYMFLEAPIMTEEPTEKQRNTLLRGPGSLTNLTNGYDSDDMEEDYFEIDESKCGGPRGARSLPLPEIPKQRRPPGQKSSVSYNPRGGKETREDSPGNFMFNSSDKTAATRVLEKAEQPGIYLVRKSRKNSNQEVLAVSTAYGVKEYQIFNVGNQKSLDKKVKFDTVKELVKFYKSNNLPTHPITLKKSYSSMDLSAE